VNAAGIPESPAYPTSDDKRPPTVDAS